MPIGSYAVVPEVVYHLVTKQPKTHLDLGIGFGMYGAAIRQWLDLGVMPYKTILHGVEGFEFYENPVWQLYDKVFIEDIQDFEPAVKYDSITMCDVIEHFTKEDGIKVLDKLKSWLNPKGIILIATPGEFCPQDAVYGNEFERHRSLWTKMDFTGEGFKVLRDKRPCKYTHSMLIAKYTA